MRWCSFSGGWNPWRRRDFPQVKRRGSEERRCLSFLWSSYFSSSCLLEDLFVVLAYMRLCVRMIGSLCSFLVPWLLIALDQMNRKMCSFFLFCLFRFFPPFIFACSCSCWLWSFSSPKRFDFRFFFFLVKRKQWFYGNDRFELFLVSPALRVWTCCLQQTTTWKSWVFCLHVGGWSFLFLV